MISTLLSLLLVYDTQCTLQCNTSFALLSVSGQAAIYASRRLVTCLFLLPTSTDDKMDAPSSSNGGLSSPRGGLGAGAVPTSDIDSQEPQRNGRINGQQQQRQRNGQNNDDDDEAMEDMDGGAAPRRRRARNLQNIEDIPPVRDETGERVREGFEAFLTESVCPSHLR